MIFSRTLQKNKNALMFLVKPSRYPFITSQKMKWTAHKNGQVTIFRAYGLGLHKQILSTKIKIQADFARMTLVPLKLWITISLEPFGLISWISFSYYFYVFYVVFFFYVLMVEKTRKSKFFVNFQKIWMLWYGITLYRAVL